MTTTTPTIATGAPRKLTRAEQRQVDSKNRLTSPAASIIAIVIAVLWTTPTAGLLITSFRPQADIRRSGWWNIVTDPSFTIANYSRALGESGMGNAFINSIVITLPGVIIPIILALLAAYAFAWIDFKGRDFLFAAVFALQVVPIQVTLIPLLSQYVSWGLAGSYWTVWLSRSSRRPGWTAPVTSASSSRCSCPCWSRPSRRSASSSSSGCGTTCWSR